MMIWIYTTQEGIRITAEIIGNEDCGLQTKMEISLEEFSMFSTSTSVSYVEPGIRFGTSSEDRATRYSCGLWLIIIGILDSGFLAMLFSAIFSLKVGPRP